ncbi:MAG: RagB/SusD family nutrient uptake outer membrane protein [Bacteroidales bacterium]|nr:RagB/SusD family nutrient uptake outer membrane protein [Bacteroidales bacterium]
MKLKNLYSVALCAVAFSLPLTSCNDWLDLKPKNEQVTADYWQSKEDVEAVVASGYYYMRQSVPSLLVWGELRSGNFYNFGTGTDASKMQDFDMTQSNSLAKYTTLYQVILMANSVLEYAPKVQQKDDTYYSAMLNSHLCEAYFQRAWAYSILVKNWKEVPLITWAYVTDDADFEVAKSSESEIIAQIKADCEAALATGAAKGTYEEDWETKCRATKWALYALMADICLWNHEFDECILYADKIIEATDAMRPAFIKNMNNWYDIFYPGLSNESIFELYWSYTDEGKNNNFASLFPVVGIISGSTSGNLNFTKYLASLVAEETAAVLANYPDLASGTTVGRIGRMYLATYYCSSISATSTMVSISSPALWKYRGTDVADVGSPRTSTNNDANFILYRVADIMLMKAEALVMKGQSSWKSAIELVNQIRVRAGLSEYVDLTSATADAEIEALDQLTLLNEVMNQRNMEFIGEGHRWYDLLRMARYDSKFAPEGTVEDSEGQTYEAYKTQGFGDDEFEYKKLVINTIAEANETASPALLQTALQNSWAWYLPLPEADITASSGVLKQNPYYKNN